MKEIPVLRSTKIYSVTVDGTLLTHENFLTGSLNISFLYVIFLIWTNQSQAKFLKISWMCFSNWFFLKNDTNEAYGYRELNNYEITQVQVHWYNVTIERLSALLAIREGNPPVIIGLPSQRASKAGTQFLRFPFFPDTTIFIPEKCILSLLY